MTRVHFSRDSISTRSLTRAFAFSLLATLSLTLSACGDYKVEEASGTGEEIADASPNAVLKDLGLTLNRVRIYKGLNPASGPAFIGTRDFYNVELWSTPSDQKLPKYADSGIRFIADDAGNLNSPQSRPGEVVQSGRTVFDSKGKSSLELWTRDAKTALMRYVPALHVYETEVTDASNVRKITKVQKKITELDKTQTTRYGQLDVATALNIANETRKIPAAGLKGRIGCEVTKETIGTSGSVTSVAYSFYDVELGDELIDADNTASVGTTDSFGDRTLYVERNTSWQLVGVNVNTRKLQILRRQSRGIYTSRSLPAKKDATKFLPSGFELAMRACNKAAKTTDTAKVQTSWRLVAFKENIESTPNVFETIGNFEDLPYCSEWADAADPAKEFSELPGTADGCDDFKTALSTVRSNWDGVKYSDDTPSTVNSSADFTDTSAIVEVSY